MSYRSDIGLAASKVWADKLRTNETVARFLKYATRHMVDQESGAELWYWRYFPWSVLDEEGNELDMSFLEREFEEIECDDNEVLYIRTGEDYEVVTLGDFEDNPFGMHLRQFISMKL